ncbi:serine/threonine protein phosphatase [Paramagnetospirillum kuznetsovii]|uniref:Serine/threonine protein phosphatase n=1 Tax=Paramagnetospirillum kuznetsovii TaxID=2053833 RepID=A0A364P1A6_9PROT|nr:fused response regulator/phosphatase [Paramagnetospirillum kuznetsovii]RAU23040.1 serine/threonine protein phosphatase [Paramagnetospirillum kuznetsovii]
MTQHDAAVGFDQCHVLVVEDNAMNRQLIAVMLEAMGVGRIEAAVDGIDGLDKVAAAPPDLIILDIMMPRMDGFEFLARLRADPIHGEIPVLVATALHEADERARAFDAGASDYVTKPIDRREFMARASVHLRSRLLVTSLRQYQSRMSRDIAAAQSMQRALLPKADRIAEIERTYGIRLASLFQSSDEVGGDLWDVIPIDEKRFGVYLADFTGHGVPAAINTFRLHLMMRKKKAGTPLDPSAVLERMNKRLLTVLQRGQLATMTCAVFDMAERKVTLSCAGAPSPIRVDGDGLTHMITEHSHPLALVAGAVYRDIDIPFRPGDAILLYSDGLSEAVDPSGELLGEEGVRLFSQRCAGDLDADVQALRDGGWRFDDDLTAVWISV